MKSRFSAAVSCILPFFVYFIAEGILSVFLYRENFPELSGSMPILAGLILDLALLPSFFYLFFRDRDKGRRCSDTIRTIRFRQCAAAVFGTIGLYLLTLITIELTGFSAGDSDFEAVSAVMDAAPPLLEFAAAVIAAPVFEELLFRGLLYNRLKQLMPDAAAILLSAFCFGWFHGNLTQGAAAFFLGSCFAFAYSCSGSFLIPVLMHMSANGTAMFLSEAMGGVSLITDLVVFLLIPLYSAVSAAFFFRTFCRGKKRQQKGDPE